MKRLAVALSVVASLHATTFTELFESLKNHAQTKSDEALIKQAEVSKKLVKSNLYPKVNLFAKYDHYTDPTGMMPVAPLTMQHMLATPTQPQPFSKDIYKVGASFSMPIFVKSLYTLADKAEYMQKSAKAKKHIDLLKNEAIIVSSNANLLYLKELKNSLDTKERSLLETEKTIKIKVESGRSPESALYKIDDALNQINIAKNSIELQKEQIEDAIRALTGITLKEPIEMPEVKIKIESTQIAALKPLELKVVATKKALKSTKEKLYPTVSAYGSYAYSYGDAYNVDKSIDETYGNVGVVVNLSLFNNTTYKEIEKSKVDLQKEQMDLQAQKEELASKARMIKESLPLLDHSIELAKKNVQNKQKLLDIAKTSYNTGRLSTEEYLRYEDELVSAKAALYQTKAKKWGMLMELSVIYAKDIEALLKKGE